MNRESRTRWIITISALVSLALLVLLMSWLRPGVPKRVTIFSGDEGTPSHSWALKYQDFVQSHGIRVDVVPTGGSGQVFDRFSKVKGEAVGFVQSGVERALGGGSAPANLQSLGSLYFEPIWLFVHDGSSIRDIPDLAGKRVYWGEPGSDARAAVLTLIDAYDFTRPAPDPSIDDLTQAEAGAALVAGELDGAFFTGVSNTDAMRQLLTQDGIHPVSARHAEVFARTHPDLANVFIPQGLFDLGHMLPRQDVTLISPAINLVAKDDIHPALVDLFLDAAEKYNRAPTLLSKRGEFPSENYTSLPMNPNATRYLEKGPGGFRRYLPFWLASLLDQLLIIGLPVFVVLSTFFKGVPVFFQWKTKLELTRFYRRLAAIENAPDRQERLDHYLKKLEVIEAQSANIRYLPLYLPDYLELHQYIHDMRERLRQGW